ncbi:TOBE domain-containing protein [Prauserella cavernicola]|uniref:TOBE domain-containing protein n=1 Tax=Prauserella cavernicola TaxID=2800127 RepID=A0A934V3N8_9PSEU|nr:TOBE domain-containing protein [Prauserella cavernicola]MBK1783909.1 TOBE domain-containing protein [Prauserella cavernicola]
MSIRNQLTGTVTTVASGEVMATVKVRLSGGQEITAAITRESVEELGLAEGTAVRVLIKATEISLATGPVNGISIRNQLPGRVAAVATGGAMATVKVSITDGELTAAITRDGAIELGLAENSAVVALVKSTEVSLATG